MKENEKEKILLESIKNSFFVCNIRMRGRCHIGMQELFLELSS